jgi:hypothetical protein
MWLPAGVLLKGQVAPQEEVKELQQQDRHDAMIAEHQTTQPALDYRTC